MVWTARARASAVGLVVLVAMLPGLSAEARTLNGSPRADTLRGTGKADTLRGRGGNDRLFGRGGADILLGGKGNDRLVGGAGRDRLGGGPGRDIVIGGPGVDVLACGGGKDRAVADAGDVVRASCEVVSGLPEKQGDGNDSPPPPPPPPPAPPPVSQLFGEYEGDLASTIRYLPDSGCVGEQTVAIPSRITVRAPLQRLASDLQSTGQDANVINLQLGQTNVLGSIVPGSVYISSASRLRFTPINSSILQYWNLALNGTALTGTLVNSHSGEAAALNLLAVNTNFGVVLGCTLPNQLAIAVGTALAGTITPQAISLTIQGNTEDTFHPFTAQITANRVR